MAEKKETIKKIVTKHQAEGAVPHARKEAGSALTLSASDLGLPKVQVSPRAFSAWVRALRQNWRQGTVACKGRSDVSHSRKKPWKQKGTGRARVGSARSPLWRGGGIIFGPQPRTRTLKIPVAMKQQVLKYLMYQLAQANKLRLLDFAAEKPKTAQAWQALKNAGLHKGVTLLVAPDDIVTHASFANIPVVQILFFDQLNAYHLTGHEQVVVLQKDLERFKEMVSRWI